MSSRRRDGPVEVMAGNDASGGHYDVAVIGTGPGGYVAAIRAAQLGLRVVAIEREHFGGICLNHGCIPTKALLRSSELLHTMRHSGVFGINATAVEPDLEAMVKRSRQVAAQLNGGIKMLLGRNGIDTVWGEATLTGRGQIQVRTDSGPVDIEAASVVIATGARARTIPDIEADGERIWTYRHALQPPHMPDRLLVIGSGAIGIEFASFYNTLGANTTVVEILPTILPTEDAEIAEFARRQFTGQGMTLLTDSSVKTLTRCKGGLEAVIRSGDEIQTHNFDTVILAVGITGNVESIGLEEIGIATDRGHIVTDDHCRSSVDGHYAIGDVAGPPWLAHKASHEGVMVAELIAGATPHPIRPEQIAGCTYSMPQIASIGLTESQALERGRSIKIGRFPFIGNGKAIALGDAEGLIKTLFDAETGELLGAHMIGTDVTELIQGYIIARSLESTEQELIRTVFPHPTLSEMMHESVLHAYGRAIHI